MLRRYIEKVTGYSRSHVARLVGKYQESGKLSIKEKAPGQGMSLCFSKE